MTKLKSMITQPIVMMSTLLVLIWVFVDVSERFIIEKNTNKSNSSDVSLKQQPNLGISKEKQQQILSLYQGYNTNTENTASSQKDRGLTREQQLQQQGLLDEVYAGNKILKLKAIINDNDQKAEPATALIMVSDIKTDIKKVEQFVNHSLVYGYTLEINNNTQITLSKTTQQGTERYQQQITLMMFKQSTDDN